MSTALKDLYSPSFYKKLAEVLETCLPGFSPEKFHQKIYTPAFEGYELKARMKHTAEVLHHFMPDSFPKAVPQLLKIVEALRRNNIREQGIEFMFLPEYIYLFGLDHPEPACEAMETVTQFTSCEFAVRPFILKYEKPLMQQMLRWSTHPDHKVRRFSSEGSRPRLPWGLAIPSFKKDPTPVLPILENLKQDPSEFVRRSVANNLNDISKDHPAVLMNIAQRWKGTSPETDAIIKHASRGLLKGGHPEVLRFYGLDSSKVEVTDLKVNTPKVKMGQEAEFCFRVSNTARKPLQLRLEYGIYFMLKNGKQARKVFKISERTYAPGESSEITRKHSFRPITTKTYYPGEHGISVIVNGEEKMKHSFLLRD